MDEHIIIIGPQPIDRDGRELWLAMRWVGGLFEYVTITEDDRTRLGIARPEDTAPLDEEPHT
jgi:hypothetical protein